MNIATCALSPQACRRIGMHTPSCAMVQCSRIMDALMFYIMIYIHSLPGEICLNLNELLNFPSMQQLGTLVGMPRHRLPFARLIPSMAW